MQGDITRQGILENLALEIWDHLFWEEEETREVVKCRRVQVSPAFQKFALFHLTFRKDRH